MQSLQRQCSKQDRGSYLNSDTIAACASAIGGPIGVIRVSGPDSHRLLGELLADNSISRVSAREMVRRPIRDRAGMVLDEAVFARFDAPKSYTGEDGFELFVHGALPVIESVLDALFSLGARRALPGEFSFRAVKNGKMSLSAAEAVSDLIASQSADAARLALEKMSGSQQSALSKIAESLRRLSALTELGIDFSDQDLDELSQGAISKQISEIHSALEHLRESFIRGRRLQEGVKVSLLGAPNSGKSSFFNALLEEERSIVSAVAGTTRDVVRESFNLRLADGGSIALRLEDTAGIRDTQDLVEAEGVTRAYRSARTADLVVWVLDASSPLPLDPSVLPPAELLSMQEKFVGLLSKVDLVDKHRLQTLPVQLNARLGMSVDWLSTSAVTRSGVREAGYALAKKAASLVRRDPGEVLLTREDHARCCDEAERHLSRALQAKELDLVASDLRHALLALEPMIGMTTPDDLLSRIFSQFCIGK